MEKVQIKAARILLGMSQADLCERLEIPLITLRRVEGKKDHAGLVSSETVEAIKAGLEAAGIQFLDEGSTASGPGVALKGATDES